MEKDLAKFVLDIIPRSMHQIRLQMRSANTTNLTIPQFRILGNIFRGRDQVSKIAEHIGISQPATSKMVDGLVMRELVERVPQMADRRQVLLKLTRKGTALYKNVRQQAQKDINSKIEKLNDKEKSQLNQGLLHLEKIFFSFLIIWFQSVAYSATPLSWEDSVKQASQSNPDLRAAIRSYGAADYAGKAAWSGFLPQLSANAAYSNGTTSSSPVSTTTYSASISATENLFAGFQDKAKIDQGDATRDISSSNLSAVKAKVSNDLKTAFATLLYAQNNFKLSQDIMHRREEDLRLVQLRFQSGRENKGSLLLSKAYLAQAELDRLQASHGIQVYQVQLGKVLGHEISDVSLVGEVPIAEPKENVDIKKLALKTPDHKQALAQVEFADAGITLARSSFFPNLNFVASTGEQGTNAFTDTNRWSVGLTLSLPLFNGGKDYYSTSSASETFAATNYNRESTDLQLLVKLKTAQTLYVETVQKLKVDQAFLQAAEARAEIARGKYNNGLLNFDEWDIIENDLINRQKNYLQSRRDRIINEAAWEQVQGIGVIP